MKQKIITYFFLSAFMFSTIGVPVTIHYCEMMKQKSISSCDICADEMLNVKSSCCEEEQNNYGETISSPNFNCCQKEFIYNKIDDEFLINKSDINLYLLLENVIHQVVLLHAAQQVELTHPFYCDSSPPFLINPELNITNSVLLI